MTILDKLRENKRKFEEQKIKNVLNGFTSNHIVIVSVDRYDERYQPTHVSEIIGFYDELNHKVIDINTGQVYALLPVAHYGYVTDPTLIEQIEPGKCYARSIQPVTEAAMNSVGYARTYDLATIKGVEETLVKPYEDFIKATSGMQNIDYFYHQKNQLEYFIHRCVFLDRLDEVHVVDTLNDGTYRISKSNPVKKIGYELCFHQIKGNRVFSEAIKSGKEYQLSNHIMDTDDLYKEGLIVASKMQNVEYSNLRVSEINIIKKKYFDCCGVLQGEKGKSFIKK